jgi:hypothetical protein
MIMKKIQNLTIKSLANTLQSPKLRAQTLLNVTVEVLPVMNILMTSLEMMRMMNRVITNKLNVKYAHFLLIDH